MSYTKATIRDLQRFQKVYPYTRRTPREHYMTDKAVMFETARLRFDNVYKVEYTFSSQFPSVPTINLTAEESDVNVFVTKIVGASGGRWVVTVEASQVFTGYVALTAEWIDCPE